MAIQERKLAECSVKINFWSNQSLILTNQKFIIHKKRGEEFFPLSKINGLTTEYKRNWILITIGLLLLCVALYGLFTNPDLISGDLGKEVGGFLFVGLACGLGLYLLQIGWKTYYFTINQSGGNKSYKVSSLSPELLDFLNQLNSKLK